jgi:hypothetical protein
MQRKFKIFDKKLNEFCEEPYWRWTVADNGYLYNSENDEWHKDEERFVVLWSTGMNDKNGTEIYDGDVLKGGKRNKFYKRITNSVVFFMESHSMFQHKWDEGSPHNASKEFWVNEPLWKVACSITPDENKRIEIIGNKYKNPELLVTK